MKKRPGLDLIIKILPLLLAGCGYPLRYALTNTDIKPAPVTTALTVQVAQFHDNRNPIERVKNERIKAGYTDLADYTYDAEFQGNIAEEITRMVIAHLNFSRTFNPAVSQASFSTTELDESHLRQLQAQKVDLVLTGEIRNFYGYYDQNLGRQLLYGMPLAVISGLLLSWQTTSGNYQTTWYWYGPGLALGNYLESRHKRQIEQHVLLKTKLVSTKTGYVVWQHDFEVRKAGPAALPGINTTQRKYQVVTWSLRDAVNAMVEEIAANSETIVSNLEKSSPSLTLQDESNVTQPEFTIQINLPARTPVQPPRAYRMGMRIGFNYAMFTGIDAINPLPKSGFFFGGYYTFKLGSKLAVQPEVIYSSKGTKVEDKYIINSVAFYNRLSTELNYIDFSPLFTFYPIRSLSLQAGPVMSLFLNGQTRYKIELPMGAGSIDETGTEKVKASEVTSPEWGVLAGVAIRQGQIELGLRQYVGLSQNNPHGDDIKNSVTQLFLGIAF